MQPLRKFFNIINRIGDFLFIKHVGAFNGFTTIFVSIILFVGFSNFIFTGELYHLIVFLLILLFCIAVTYAFINEKGIRKYIVFGKRKSFKEMFRTFSFPSYCVSLIFISIFLCIPIIGILLVLTVIGKTEFQEIQEILLHHKLVISYTVLLIETILWFAYHIVSGKADIQDIKIKLMLFSAVAVTILILSDVFWELENFKLLAGYILASYFWVNFLIEMRVKELNKWENKS